jgi:RNA polymerase sigma-70 factor (ECF subfamily)
MTAARPAQRECFDRAADPRSADAALIERARAADPAALRTLVARFTPDVHALAWRLAGPRRSAALADDLTQDAFVRAIGALPRFDANGPAKLRTWLLTIAARTVIDWLRRNPAAKLAAPLAIDPASTDDDPERAHERRQTAEAVARAIDALSPDMRATFVLRAYHELELAEIAAALELDVGTVKSRLSRARAALRAALEGRLP